VYAGCKIDYSGSKVTPQNFEAVLTGTATGKNINPTKMRSAVFASSVAAAQGAHYAVLVAGSNSYSNYRHQADVCHAYQVVKANGIPAENIVVMAYDDIANNSRNPFPGQLFNKPTASGVAGTDVYAGCKIDYSGSKVTPQ